MSTRTHAELVEERKQELLTGGIVTEIGAVFAAAAIGKAQEQLKRVSRGSITAKDYANSISEHEDRYLQLLGLKGAAYSVAATMKDPGHPATAGIGPSILFNTTFSQFETRLGFAAGSMAEDLGQSGTSARITALVSFYDGDSRNLPEHASVELSLDAVQVGTHKEFRLVPIRLTTFTANSESGRAYGNMILTGVRDVRPMPVDPSTQRRIVPVDGKLPERDRRHFDVVDKGLSFAFALERLIDPSASAERTLEDYITIFAGWAASL